LEDNPTPDTIALVAGDQDYFPTLERCVRRNWEVQVYFWEQASSALKSMGGTQFINLDNSFNSITFIEKARE
ncbi:MAG: NYN domain-containing protein, partial [Okeania sp. SIO2H7]|nr:NYN domain-containing protein [Okeania sp. SIO2H7]